jgi:hypothetical protein
MWEKLPYALHGDSAGWDREGKSHGQSMLNLWTKYAPNLKSAVLDWFVRSPLDTERTLQNMIGGDLQVGARTRPGGYKRPFPARDITGHIGRECICAAAAAILAAMFPDSLDTTAPKLFCQIWDCVRPGHRSRLKSGSRQYEPNASALTRHGQRGTSDELTAFGDHIEPY